MGSRASCSGANFGSVAVQGSETVAETYLSALHGPTKHGLAETAEMLLKRGATPICVSRGLGGGGREKRDPSGNTALMLAARNWHAE